MKIKSHYFDYAAATPLAPEVLRAMIPHLKENYGNPSSFHYVGKEARDAVEKSRKITAGILNCAPEEIIFTGGGTEADNLAIIGGMKANGARGDRVIVSAIEHHAVLEPAGYLRKEGFETKIAPVGSDGLIDLNKLKKIINKKTVLVSLMYANNEIGVIQDLKRISKTIKKLYCNALFHTDACAAVGWLDLDVEKLGVDLLSFSAQKFYGPKGVGALYVRRGVKLQPLMYGGFQEKTRRPGTENVAGIVGMAAALELAERRKKSESARLSRLRDYAIARILGEISKSFLNGHPKKRLPGNINITILDIEGEGIMSYLAERGIFISTGSACVSESLDPSHVILALGYSYEVAHGSVRITLGRETKKNDLDFLIDNLKRGVEFLRRLSPVRLKMSNGRTSS